MSDILLHDAEDGIGADLPGNAVYRGGADDANAKDDLRDLPARLKRNMHAPVVSELGVAVPPIGSGRSRLDDDAAHRRKRARVPNTVLLVRVGASNWLDAPLSADMTASGVLRALKADDVFGPSLKDRELAVATVNVGLTTQEEEPTASELASAVRLRGVRTLAQVLGDRQAADARIFVDITVQSAAVSAGPAVSLNDSPEFAALYNAIASDAPSPVGVKLWTLGPPEGSTPLWPVLGARVLVERDFYSKYLAAAAWMDNLSGKQRRHLVLGQPGIGKTSFGLWLIVMLLRQGRTVVYSYGTSQYSGAGIGEVLFTARSAWVADGAGHLGKYLRNANTVHICDSMIPHPFYPCYKVVISSPDERVCEQFRDREDALTMHVPLYSEEELEALRGAEYSGRMSREAMRTRIAAWGPVPRRVFFRRKGVVKQILTSWMRLSPPGTDMLPDEVHTAQGHAVHSRCFHTRVPGIRLRAWRCECAVNVVLCPRVHKDI